MLYIHETGDRKLIFFTPESGIFLITEKIAKQGNIENLASFSTVIY